MRNSELILNPDGSIYHLKLQPDQIADTILLVGDPGRTDLVASYFDRIDYQGNNREIYTRTGEYKGKRISVLSTGMGTDNIDIVINELDALVNIDLSSRKEKTEKRSLKFIRIGTSGALHSSIDVNSFLFSSAAIGMDGLLHYYEGNEKIRNIALEKSFKEHTQWPDQLPAPYAVEGDASLVNHLSAGFDQGITVTASGFYAPQGRVLRVPLSYPHLNPALENFEFQGRKVTNFEMETSALYGLSALLGHQAATACVIVANRVNKTFTDDYKPAMKNLITHVLDRVCK